MPIETSLIRVVGLYLESCLAACANPVMPSFNEGVIMNAVSIVVLAKITLHDGNCTGLVASLASAN
jgi:hypothetical protein